MQKFIHEYIRERVSVKHRTPQNPNAKQIVGIIVGTVVEGQIVIGWSKTNLKEGDVYSKDQGMSLALSRAQGYVPSPETPNCIKYQIEQFRLRCLRYFKDADVMSVSGSFVRKRNQMDQTSQDIRNVLDMIKVVLPSMGMGYGVIAGDGPLPQELKDFADLIG